MSISQRHPLPAPPAGGDPRRPAGRRRRQPTTSTHRQPPRPRRLPHRDRRRSARCSPSSSPESRRAIGAHDRARRRPDAASARHRTRDPGHHRRAGPTSGGALAPAAVADDHLRDRRRRPRPPRWPRRSTPTASTPATATPTVRAFEDAVADLEGAEAARAFASGMGAVTGVILGLCSAGRPHRRPAPALLADDPAPARASAPASASTSPSSTAPSPGAFAAAVRPGKTTLVLAETPANPRLDLVDLDEIGAITGPVTCVDSTFATPLGQQPARPRRRPRRCTRPPRASPATTTPPSAWSCGSQELIDWLWGFAVLQGANASPVRRHERPAGPAHPRRPARAARARPPSALAEALEASPHVDGRALPGPRLPSPARPGQAPDGPHRRRAGLRRGRRPGGRAGASSSRCSSPSMATSLGGPETLVYPPGVDHPRRACCPTSWRPPASARAPSACRSASSTPTTSSPTSTQALGGGGPNDELSEVEHDEALAPRWPPATAGPRPGPSTSSPAAAGWRPRSARFMPNSRAITLAGGATVVRRHPVGERRQALADVEVTAAGAHDHGDGVLVAPEDGVVDAQPGVLLDQQATARAAAPPARHAIRASGSGRCDSR